MDSPTPVSQIRSKQRVADHGEVFTPSWMVDAMLDLVQNESERIDSRFLEPACGSGNFLTAVLKRKLATVELKFGKSEFEKRHHALFGLMCIYGIELLQDNAEECRENLLEIFDEYLGVNESSEWHSAAFSVLKANIVQGDALSMTSADGIPIVFPEWAYLTKGKYSRRDFSYESLTERSAVAGSLFEFLEEHEIFAPVREYSPMTVLEIARGVNG